LLLISFPEISNKCIYSLEGRHVPGSRLSATAGIYLGRVALSASRGLSKHFPEPFVIDNVIGAVFLQFEKDSVDAFAEFASLGKNEALVLNVEELTDGLSRRSPKSEG
jgi:hypothetical protein